MGNKNDSNPQANDSNNEAKELTAAQAAKLVKRSVVGADKNGKPTTKQVAVTTDEVASFKDYGDYVVVVTQDGQKLRSDA